MPLEDKTNKNIPNLDTFKVGIDPVFKGNPSQQNLEEKITPAGAFNTLNNQQYTPTTPYTPIPKPNINSTGPKSILRTYKGDLAEAIQTNHLSSINIAIAENEKMHNQIQAESPKTVPAGDYSKNKIIIFVSLTLVIIGIIGITTVLLIKGQNPTPATQVQELPSLITTEYKDELNINSVAPGKFASALGSKLNDTQIQVNNLDNVYLTIGTSSGKRLLTASEFISQMDFRMPDTIKRTLLPNFMVGMFSFGQNLPFVIFKTSYFENAYAGMLAWEKDLTGDFQILFRLPGYGGVGGISAQLTPSIAGKFEDGIIVNKDVRLIRDENGNIIFLYGIIDKETIVITVSDTAFKEIVNRLNKERELQR